MNCVTFARALIVPLLLVVLCVGFAKSPARAGAVSAGSIQGDVNCSGAADAADALQILVGVANSAASDAACADGAGDVDCDGDTDLDDAMRILRFAASLEVGDVTGCVRVGDYLVEPPTSEELIAAGLEAGDVTYEQSLLYRAYALFDDPRLPAEYQSPVRNWDAGSDLFSEIDANEGQISAGTLADLQEFRVRPNDPASILYDTPESGQAAQGANRAWRTSLVPNTDARVWTLGDVNAEKVYIPLIQAVWPRVITFIGAPNPDTAGVPNSVVNPDTAVDFYFVDPGVDPRSPECETANADPDKCLTESDDGMAKGAEEFVANKSSGYLVVNKGTISGDPLSDDNLVDTIAHEMAHLSQFAYDRYESSWLKESTATWVAYRVMLDMGRDPDYAHNRVRDLFGEYLDRPLTDLTGPKAKYRPWLFFQKAAMMTTDGIVKSIWNNARPAGPQGIDAVNTAFNLDANFDQFTVQNWNKKPPLTTLYKEVPQSQPDTTFPDVEPYIDWGKDFTGEGEQFLDLPVEALSARYYDYTFGDNVRHVIFENNLVQTPHAHVWLLKKISGDWKPPEDMKDNPVDTWCRDSQLVDENLQELVVIVSNSEIASDTPGQAPPAPLQRNFPRVIADQIACKTVEGVVHATLHVQNEGVDLTYDSGDVPVIFEPRVVQPEPGDIYYDLSSRSPGVTWHVSGSVNGCSAAGEASAAFPGGEFTGVELDGGYLVVIAPGDNHSLIINAYPGPGTTFTVTCPGDPPTVSQLPFDGGLLLEALGFPNSENGTRYQGDSFLVLGHDTYHFTWDLAVS